MAIACIQDGVITLRDRFSELEMKIDKKIDSHQRREDKLHRRYAWKHPRRRR